jgi:hypothetical protein
MKKMLITTKPFHVMRNTGIFVSIIMLLTLTVQGQQQQDYTEEVTIVAPYEPSISNARKIYLSPSIKIEKLEKQELTYEIIPQKIDVKLELDPLEAVRVQDDKRVDLKNNFIKGGFGNYATPYGELYTTSNASSKHRLGLHLKHLSHNGDIKGVADPSGSLNQALVFGEKFFKKSSLYGRASYDRKVVRYYGFEPDNLVFADDDIKQIYQTFNASMAYENLDKDEEAFDFHLKTDFYHWANDDKSLENQLHFNIYGNKPVEWFDFLKYQSFGLTTEINFVNSGDSINAINVMNMDVKPFLHTKSGVYDLKAGINLSVLMDDEQQSFVTFYPDVQARIHLVPDFLTLFGGLTGHKKVQTFRNLSFDNPFIKATIERKYTNHKVQVYGGMTGNITRGFDFSLKYEYQEIENHPLFVKDFQNSPVSGRFMQFQLAYDTLKMSTFSGGIVVKGLDRFTLSLDGAYHQYTTRIEEKPWHMPAFELNSHISYELQQSFPLTLSLGTTLLTGRYAKNQAGNAVALDNIVDINAGAAYHFSPSLDVFLQLNNLLTENQYWYDGYPSYGLNLLVGVSYSF